MIRAISLLEEEYGLVMLQKVEQFQHWQFLALRAIMKLNNESSPTGSTGLGNGRESPRDQPETVVAGADRVEAGCHAVVLGHRLLSVSGPCISHAR
jgi:hypothetical protein